MSELTVMTEILGLVLLESESSVRLMFQDEHGKRVTTTPVVLLRVVPERLMALMLVSPNATVAAQEGKDVLHDLLVTGIKVIQALVAQKWSSFDGVAMPLVVDCLILAMVRAVHAYLLVTADDDVAIDASQVLRILQEIITTTLAREFDEVNVVDAPSSMLTTLLGHSKMNTMLDAVCDYFVLLCLEWIATPVEGEAGKRQRLETDIIHVTDMFSFLARSGDVVAMFIENPQVKKGSFWNAVASVIESNPPEALMLSTIRMCRSLFAMEDPEFVDEMWERDDGTNRKPLFRVTSGVVVIIRAAVQKRSLTSDLLHDALFMIELLSDDSNFKHHVTEEAVLMILEVLSYPGQLVLATMCPNSSVPLQKNALAAIFRIMAGLHCFNSDAQPATDQGMFLRAATAMIAGHPERTSEFVDLINILENLKVVGNIMRGDPDRGTYMNKEELQLVMDCTCQMLNALGPENYRVVGLTLEMDPSARRSVPKPVLKSVKGGQATKKRKTYRGTEVLKWIHTQNQEDVDWSALVSDHGSTVEKLKEAVDTEFNLFLTQKLTEEMEQQLRDALSADVDHATLAQAWTSRRPWRMSPYVVKRVVSVITAAKDWSTYELEVLGAVLQEHKSDRPGQKVAWTFVARRLFETTKELRTALMVKEAAIAHGLYLETRRGGGGVPLL